MAGTSGGAAAWRISGEDRAKHDSQFFQLKPVNGFITGDQARGFFMQSGLPTPVLGQIWTLADMNNDGKMDKKEFSIAMHLIKKKLQGYELPKSLPSTLKADPSPVMGSFGVMSTGSMSMGPTSAGMGVAGMPVIGTMAPTAMVASPMMMPVMSNGVQPGFGGGGAPAGMMDNKPRAGSFTAQVPNQGGLSMPHQSKLKYTQMFNTNDRNKKGFLTGVEARALLMQSGLPQPMLAQVWTLSDVDKDGKLSCDEFCIAMHLIDVARMGCGLPQTLPPELHPSAAKGRSGSFGPTQPPVAAPQPAKQADSFGDLLGSMGMPTNVSAPEVSNGDAKQEQDDLELQTTFEDKRKENFAKGQAELERRRQMLQDQMKREQEARMEKERQEQEKRERIRQEQERKRQMEIERQMEKQRQIEREREEQRNKMMEQREAARREMDRQRQMEWERQRKEQLLAEKRREYEQLGAIKSRSSDLKCELESQEGKKTELSMKINQVRNGVTDFTTSIEGMRTTRDTKISEIERLQNELQTLTMNYTAVQREREDFQIKMQTTIQSNPLSETHRTVLHSVELKKTAIQKMKKDLEQIERDTESKLLEIDNSNTEIQELNKKLTSIQEELATLQKQQQQKQTDAKQVKRKQDDDLLNKQKQEKEKQEKLRKELSSQRQKEQEMKTDTPADNSTKTSSQQQGSWFDFESENKSSATAVTNAQDDVWSSAFSAENLSSKTGNDIWNAFSSQNTDVKPSTTNTSTEVKHKYRALYQFEARNQDELTLTTGDTVMVFEDQNGAEPGWVKGECNGKSGWFPKDYVEKVPEDEPSLQATAFSGATTNTTLPGVSSIPDASQVSKADESSFSSVRPMMQSPTPGQGTAAPDGLQAQALYPWKAKKDNHLTFNKGDIIIVKEQQDMWWSGELNGQVGWFPKSYVKLKGTTSSSLGGSRSGTPLSNFPEVQSDGSARSTPQLQQQEATNGEYYTALYAYKSIEAEDLNFNMGDEILVIKMDGDWWTGTQGDRTGIFPANYVKKSEKQSASVDQEGVGQQVPTVTLSGASDTERAVTPTADTNQTSQKSTSLKKPEIASVIAAYTATGTGQLSLQPGQLIQVRKKSASGWWEGELQARGQKRKIGWFPANYVKLLGSSSTRSTPDTGLQNQQRVSPASMINRTSTPTIPPPQLNAAEQSDKYVDQVVALFPYTAQNDDELTFHNGSVINVIKKDDANWWQGEVNGHTGMFPSNYVGPLTASATQEQTWSSDPTVLAKTSVQESKRQNYIHELINTEVNYMEDMSIVLDAFYRPMNEARVMTDEELAAIFVNWNELILCNTKLSKSLKVRKKMCGKGQVINVIGDILCENLPHLTPYIRFCSCQLNAAALLQHKTETSPDFKEVQKKCVQDSRTKGMPLSSFLLKPMQRITKYPLMIEKILQYTPESHPDRQNLMDALSKAEELCSQVNEGVRERENCDRLEWLQTHVQCDGLPEKLTFNSVTNCLGPRKLLFSGTLYKVKSNKELVAFLFNDFLLLTQPLSSSSSVFVFDPKAKTQYKMYRNPIFLNEVMVKKSSDEDSDPCQFQLSHVDRVFHLRATNQTEGGTWVKNIGAASRNFLDTDRRKREKAHSSESKSQGVGRLLVILLEGINLAPTEDVRRTAGVGRLLAVILEGCDLQPSDMNGKSDPFCEVSMGSQEHKTKVIPSTLNPKWNQSMQFIIRDVEEDVLCITVFDRDVFSPNDFLGRTEVRVKEIMEDNRQTKGPITKRLLLHEVSKGEVLVKLDLQLYDNT